MTAAEVAALFGVGVPRVRFLARKHGVGTKTPDGWVFTAEDVEKMRPAPRGGVEAKTQDWLRKNPRV